MNLIIISPGVEVKPKAHLGVKKTMHVFSVEKYAFQVLAMVKEGYSYRQIAKQFHLSQNIVMDVVERFKPML